MSSLNYEYLCAMDYCLSRDTLEADGFEVAGEVNAWSSSPDKHIVFVKEGMTIVWNEHTQRISKIFITHGE